MNYSVRDEGGRFVKKEVQGNNATQEEVITTGRAEIKTQVGTTVTTETTTTIIYFDSIEEFEADIDRLLAPLGITGVGTTVDKALRIAGVEIKAKETISEPANP